MVDILLNVLLTSAVVLGVLSASLHYGVSEHIALAHGFHVIEAAIAAEAPFRPLEVAWKVDRSALFHLN